MYARGDEILKNSLIASTEMLFFLLSPRVSALYVAIKSGPANLNVRALYDKKFCYAAVQNGTLKASNSRRKTNRFLSLYMYFRFVIVLSQATIDI